VLKLKTYIEYKQKRKETKRIGKSKRKRNCGCKYNLHYSIEILIYQTIVYNLFVIGKLYNNNNNNSKLKEFYLNQDNLNHQQGSLQV